MKPTKQELKIINEFINLINSDEISDRLKSDIRATLHHTFKEVEELKEYLSFYF